MRASDLARDQGHDDDEENSTSSMTEPSVTSVHGSAKHVSLAACIIDIAIIVILLSICVYFLSFYRWKSKRESSLLLFPIRFGSHS